MLSAFIGSDHMAQQDGAAKACYFREISTKAAVQKKHQIVSKPTIYLEASLQVL